MGVTKIDTTVYAIRTPSGMLMHLHPDWRVCVEAWTGGFRSKTSKAWKHAESKGVRLVRVRVVEQ